MSKYHTVLASDASLLHACYRLRYEVYVKEMSRRQFYADPEQRTIVDPLDEDGAVFACFHQETCSLVGTIRVNLASCRNLMIDEYLNLYQIANLENLNKVSLTTRLMVLRQHRGLAAVTSLVSGVFSHCLLRGVDSDYMDCNPPLPILAKRFGYETHLKSVRHPEYGDVEIMKLSLTDISHLVSVQSPFVRVYHSTHGVE